jgi:hypothetical protein
MTDQHVAGQLKALAEDYERRAEKAAHADAAKTQRRLSLKRYEAAFHDSEIDFAVIGD